MDDRRGYKIDEIEFNSEDEEHDFKNYLKSIVELYGSTLDHASLGITKLVIDNGFDGLSEKQRFVFQEYVLDPYTQKECIFCHTDIPWCEMHANIPKEEEDGLCSWCRHREEKDD